MFNSIESTSFLNGENIEYLEYLYKKYLEDEDSIDPSWIPYFKTLNDENSTMNTQLQTAQIIPFNQSREWNDAIASSQNEIKLKVKALIGNYKKYWHLKAKIDPLNLVEQESPKELSTEYNEISEKDLAEVVEITNFWKLKVSELIDKLEKTYCSSIGAEFDHIRLEEERQWLEEQIENPLGFDMQEKKKILSELIRSTKFEDFLHKKFPGAKRFSVEGWEALIPALEKIIDILAENKSKKIVIGMAHRGRLNVLTWVMWKGYEKIMSEFKWTPWIPEGSPGSWDVKYHMWYANTRQVWDHNIDLSLAFNPSHLEVVNSVVMWRIRAKQDLYNDTEKSLASAVLIHGDAAFAGQGSVYETTMMSGIDWYDIGGVIHIIVNNQIWFTANPKDSRSTPYCSEVAKVIEAPILHVNGDDIEEVVKAMKILTEFREKFQKDVFLDIYCYRKYGHNEWDEPMFTQPQMYKAIKAHQNPMELYAQKLIEEKSITQDEYNSMQDDFTKILDESFKKADTYKPKELDWLGGSWSHIENEDSSNIPDTSISKEILSNIITSTTQFPENFHVNSKVKRSLDAKKKMFEEWKPIDWSTGEALAFWSLLGEKFKVRITGQDSGRGTFSHRHSVFHDGETWEKYIPLNHISEDQAEYEVHDSLLSELAVLGYEYWYSLSAPDALTIWEGQFWDFSNGAQMIIDQFIASSETKWFRKSNLTMLLPHGYEGQWPEHSSARLERYLQACAENNMRVVNCTTPANFFHCLRRQVHSKDRKPLVVMSPKSLLRHKSVVSNIEDFTHSKFKPIIWEKEKLVNVKKVILCSGKVYYDLLEARETKKINDTAILRVEQFYPFDTSLLQKELGKYKWYKQIVWCQEESKNMWAWNFIRDYISEASGKNVEYIWRPASASPATWYAKIHEDEIKKFIEESFS